VCVLKIEFTEYQANLSEYLPVILWLGIICRIVIPISACIKSNLVNVILNVTERNIINET